MIKKQNEIPDQSGRLTGDQIALVAPQEPSGEISLVQLANVLLRHRWLIIGLPLLLAMFFAIYSLTRPRLYTASATFMPQASEMTRSGLASVAAQFGVAVPAGQLGQSPAFYAALLTSREIVGQAVTAPYDFSAKGERHRASGVDLLVDEPGGSPEARVQTAIEKLQNAVTVGTSRETGVVRVSVTTRWAPFSQQVTTRLLGLVNDFNLKRRQSQAGAERQFVEQRLAAAKRELQLAEDRLKYFLQANRAYEGSPQLRFEKDRLQRDVDLKQQVFSSLSQSYEQARIEEVRNIPVTTVIEQPVIPIRGDSRGTLARAATGLVVGIIVALLLAFSLEFARNKGAEGGSEVEQFATLRKQFFAELRHPFRSLRRAR